MKPCKAVRDLFGICSGRVPASFFFYNAKLLQSELAVVRFYTIPAIE